MFDNKQSHREKPVCIQEEDCVAVIDEDPALKSSQLLDDIFLKWSSRVEPGNYLVAGIPNDEAISLIYTLIRLGDCFAVIIPSKSINQASFAMTMMVIASRAGELFGGRKPKRRSDLPNLHLNPFRGLLRCNNSF